MFKHKKVVSGHQLRKLAFEYYKIVVNNRISNKESRKNYLKEFEKSKCQRAAYISFIKIYLNHHSSLEEMCRKAHKKDYCRLQSNSALYVELPKIKKIIEEFVKNYH